MKKIIITAILASMPLMAQDAPAPQRQAPTAEQLEQMINKVMEKFDKDADNQLNPTEFVALKKALAKHAPKKKKGPNPKILAKYDSNKDGKLSKEERKAMKEDRKANKPERTPLTDEQKAERKAKSQAKQLAKYDIDKNGYLSREELAAAAQKHAQKMQKAKGKQARRACNKQA